MATYQEVYEASKEYFNGDELAADVFIRKYALTAPDGDIKEITPFQMHQRLAKEFARIEKAYADPISYEEIFEAFHKFQYLVPQGSPMAGIGNPYQTVSLSNCFVIDSPKDSYGGILHTDQEQAQLMKRRGGVGFDISNIRPRGVVTNNAAKTSDGIGIFMERFSNTTREVGQGGRRGALMLTIDVHHPEVETFINIKRDKTKVTGANISVRLSDEFMRAVVDDTEYEQRFPVNSPWPTITRSVRARDIWDQIINAAWESAEPGLLFWDTATRRTPSDAYVSKGFGSTATNPCQPLWAPVLTPVGIKTIGEINIGDTIWSGEKWTIVEKKVSTGVKPVYAYKTNAGTFYGTENHRVLSGGVKIEAKDAETIDISCGHFNESVNDLDMQAVVDGLVVGDGTVHKASNNLVLLLLGEKDFDTKDFIKSHIKEHRPGIKETAYEVITTITAEELPRTYNRKIPNRYFYGSPTTVRSFLKGIYAANGAVSGGRITLKATSPDIIEQVQIMLSSLGIRSYKTTNKPKVVKFKNGSYLCKESYDLNITHDKDKFKKAIGFIQEYKKAALEKALTGAKSNKIKVTYDINEVQLLGEEPVIDITVEDEKHQYWTGGLLVSNCGEIILSPNDSCRLLVVNLWGFVENPFTPEATFNWNKYHKYARLGQRLMDDLIDLEIEAIDRILMKVKADPEPEIIKAQEVALWEKIKKACVEGRRTGLGITALGDVIAALGMRYGSDESVAFTEEIYKKLAIGSYTESIHLAKVRGAFPAFELDLEKDHEFIKQVVSVLPAEVQADYLKYGRRNIANTTTAPVGSVSIETQTTSGIEPVYLPVMIRRRKINPQDVGARVDFTDHLGDKWQEYKVFHPKFKVWMEVTGLDDVEASPYNLSTSADVDWTASVRLQGAAQKWVCHAISKTCNLPSNVSRELVADVYLEAWKAGCKGFTVYRDGCRTGVLVAESNKEEKKEGLVPRDAPKRPDSLECDIFHVKMDKQPFTVVVGLMNGLPYEVFCGHPIKDLEKKYEKGQIVKVSHGKSKPATYNLVVKNGVEEVIEDLNEALANTEYGAFTRSISTSLRHGTPVQYMVEQLQKGDKSSDMHSYEKVIARCLKKYIKDGAKSSGDKVCNNCGAESLIYQEGCLTCTSCGNSKCG